MKVFSCGLSFDFNIFKKHQMISDPERFRRLSGLSPVEAVAAWLRGDFGVGDDVAMIEAIRRDERIRCTDEAIASYFMVALAAGEKDAGKCLEELAKM